MTGVAVAANVMRDAYREARKLGEDMGLGRALYVTGARLFRKMDSAYVHLLHEVAAKGGLFSVAKLEDGMVTNRDSEAVALFLSHQLLQRANREGWESLAHLRR